MELSGKTVLIAGGQGYALVEMAEAAATVGATTVIIIDKEQNKMCEPEPFIIKAIPIIDLPIIEDQKRRRKSQRENPFKYR